MLCVSLKTKGYLFKATLEFLGPGSESKARRNEREILKEVSEQNSTDVMGEGEAGGGRTDLGWGGRIGVQGRGMGQELPQIPQPCSPREGPGLGWT